MGIAVRSGLAGAALCVLAACGGGGGGSSVPVNPGNPGGGSGTYTPGVFAARTSFANQCIAPRAGTSDSTGTAFTEKMFLRSWTNDLYLWYNEVPDTNPANVANVTRLLRHARHAADHALRAPTRIASTSSSIPMSGSRCRRAVNRSATARNL